MKKDDDFINENSINDLIQYAEEESDTPEETYEEETDTYADEQADEEITEEDEIHEEKPAMQSEPREKFMRITVLIMRPRTTTERLSLRRIKKIHERVL